jgi:hypothetical protein
VVEVDAVEAVAVDGGVVCGAGGVLLVKMSVRAKSKPGGPVEI